VAIKGSCSHARFLGNVIEACIGTAARKRLLRDRQNALAIPLRVGARLPLGRF